MVRDFSQEALTASRLRANGQKAMVRLVDLSGCSDMREPSLALNFHSALRVTGSAPHLKNTHQAALHHSPLRIVDKLLFIMRGSNCYSCVPMNGKVLH